MCQKKSASLVCVICTIYSSISLVLVSAHESHKSLLEQLVSNGPELLYSVAVSHHSRVVEIIPLDNVKNSSCAMLSRGNVLSSFYGFTPALRFSRSIQFICNIRENADQFLNKMAVLQWHINQGVT